MQRWNSRHKLSIEVEAQPVWQETTKSHKNHAKSAGRVKQRQREGTEPNKGTVRERQRITFPVKCSLLMWDSKVNQQRLRSRTKPRGQDEKEARARTAAPTMESEAWSTCSARNSASPTGKTERGRCVLQTALNGRSKAEGIEVGHLWDVESRCHNQRAGAQKGLEGWASWGISRRARSDIEGGSGHGARSALC